MERKLMVIGMLACSLLSACGNQELSSDTNVLETENVADSDANKIEIKDTPDVEQQREPFLDPFVEGKLSYTVQSCNIYITLAEANVEKDMLIEPHNTYFSQEMGEEYQTVSDFINEDGSIVDTHEFVVLEMKIENEDAVGLIKKNEFNISNIALRGGENVSQYNVAYFSEAGKTNMDQPLHYTLDQGNSLDIRIGYLVLKEDMENIVGAVSDSDVQFSINE
ncbi:MAG: hypothetical protein HDR01_13595 [Lachnospiraceae bacterium]|nr:hypothetical protein [Lachnospiraceae bacterium]